MISVKNTAGVLIVTFLLSAVGLFLPGIAALYDNYFLGFSLTLASVLIFRWLYKVHMARVAELSPDIRKQREEASQKWWKKSSEATMSPTHVHDHRNIYNNK